MRYTVLILLLLSLVACAAPSQWAPGPGVALAEFEPTKARCSLMARHSGGSFSAYGSPNFVAGAALGNAIAESARAQADFSDCMKGSGWIPVTKEVLAARDIKVAQLRGIVDQRKACVAETRTRVRYAILQSHWPDATGQYSMAQLTNDHPPTPAEAGALASYWDDSKVCSDSAFTEFSKIDPRLVAILSQQRSDNEAVIISLVKRQISWGEADQRQKVNNDVAQQKLRSVNL
jgi:hypothetical protein